MLKRIAEIPRCSLPKELFLVRFFHPSPPPPQGVPAPRVGVGARTRHRRRPAVAALVAAFGRILGTGPLKDLHGRASEQCQRHMSDNHCHTL